ncbi:MAG: hypothetical protein JWO85_2601 [Candidatus Eremiobacteraeota bacterium]|jgi:hypothetical protein|nr:hypothetical protein [Candidatus Eremiobacteraeota bacterium]
MAPRLVGRVAAPALLLLTLNAIAPGEPARAAANAAAAATFGPRPTAAQVLARFTEHDALLDSYTVPVHVDVHLHKLITFHFGLNGTAYYKRPDRVALDLRSMPAAYRHVFAEIGSPLTWGSTYELRVRDVVTDENRTTYRIEGTPRRPGDVDRMLVDFDTDASAVLRGRWIFKDGTTIAMMIEESAAGPYQLPKRAEADLDAGGYRVHAVLDYGAYSFNAVVADSVFSGG